MRLLVAITSLLVVLSGCTASVEPDADLAPGTEVVPVMLEETYRGTVISAKTAAFQVSPDQAGDVERWFYVHNGTTGLDLALRTNQFDLTMEVYGPDCHDADCAMVVTTADRAADHHIEAPQPGPWEVHFFLADEGAEEVYYELTLTKTQERMHDPEHEVYEGAVVALHLGAIRISPDQLGEVYREFWVAEGTRLLTIDVATTEDIHFVVGQSRPARDRGSEQGHDTEGGWLELVFEDPQPGGWYFIFFHTADGPGIARPDYTVDVEKRREAA